MTRTEPEQPGAPDTGPDHAKAAGIGGFDRLRLLLAVAMGTVLVSYAMLVPSAAAVVLTAGVGGRSLDGAFGTTVPVWLAAHHIPLTVDDRPLSVLPLLPMIGVLLVAAVGAGWAVHKLGGRSPTDSGAVVAAIAGAHAAVAVLAGALLSGTAAVTVAPWPAMVGGGLVGGIGAGVGVLHRCGLPAAWNRRLPTWAPHALLATGVAVAGLLLVGALVLLAGVVLRAGAVTASFAGLALDGGSGLGIALLVLAYLPNAVIAAIGWGLGPGVAVGAAATSPFAVFPGQPPTFPLLAVLPEAPPPAWSPAVFVLPAAVGVLTGLRCRGAAPADRLPAILAATVSTAAATAALAALAGGRLAAGPFDPVDVPPVPAGAAVLLWVGVPAVLVYLFLLNPPTTRVRAGRTAEAAAAEPAEDVSVPPAGPAPARRRRRSRAERQDLAAADTPAEPDPWKPGVSVEPAERDGTADLPRRPRRERRLRRRERPGSGTESAEPTPDEAPASPPRPRTVGELVAQRAREAQERAATGSVDE